MLGRSGPAPLKPPSKIELPNGLDTALMLCWMIEHRKETKFIAEVLEDIKAKTDAGNKIISTVGKASEIETLWAKAEAAKTDAEELLRQAAATRTAAKVEAKQIVDAASAAVLNKSAELENRARALATDQRFLQEAVAAHEEARIQREQAADKRDQAQDEYAAKMVEQQSDLVARETELKTQWQRLKAAMP